MVEVQSFKEWLKNHTGYSEAVICDTSSRIKRADSILEWNGNETYLFYLEKENAFVELSVSVRSQLRKAVKLYAEYFASINSLPNH